MSVFTTVTTVDGTDIPNSVEEWLEEDMGVYIHAEVSRVDIEDDGNPFSEWLKENGFVFPTDKNWVNIVIMG